MSTFRRLFTGHLRALALGGVASAALLTACGKKEPAQPAGPPLVTMIRAADWMGSEWSEDAIKFAARHKVDPELPIVRRSVAEKACEDFIQERNKSSVVNAPWRVNFGVGWWF